MSGRRWMTAELCAIAAVVGGVWVSAQQAPLPYGPPRAFGDSITGAFEGWFDNKDGSRNFLVGYMNRNLKQPQDVPIGPNNRIEPGGPDMGQPTHFKPARQTGMFIVTVPKGFAPDQKLTWTITINGQTTQIPLRSKPDYNVNPFSDVAVGNTPPRLRLVENATPIQGPVATLANAPSVTATVNTQVTLTAWVDDDGKYSSGSNAPVRDGRSPVEVSWSKYRGAGQVTFSREKAELKVAKGGGVDQPFSAIGTASVKFSAPGEYALLAVANDYSGEGGNGEVCCWTNAYLKVTVK